MQTRLLWRRSATALGLYGSVALGFLAGIVAARRLGPDEYGLFTLAIFAARYGVPPNDIIAANRVRQRKSNGHLLNNRLRVPATVQVREQRAAPVAQAAVRPAVIAPRVAVQVFVVGS